MAYTTYVYLIIFLGITFILYTLFPKKYKWFVLLAASYFYYIAASKLWLIVFLLMSTITIYISALWLDKINELFSGKKESLSKEEKKVFKEKTVRKKKLVVVLMLIVNMGALVILKYFNFFSAGLNYLVFDKLNMTIPVLNLFLPLGISFYTLQAVSYVIDVYRGKYKADSKITRVALYLSFFPTIVEGPITRYDQVAHQLYEGHSFSYTNMVHGVQLILWGMFKKIVIADTANMLVNFVFSKYEQYSGLSVIVAIVFYTIQLYTEFSGCMDIVRGSAQLFSVNLPENFRQPFFSRSINEFWQRWHITLGSWLKEYIFYSVSLSALFKRFNHFLKNHTNKFWARLLPSVTALFFVWIGNGLWHGAGLKYTVYGMYYYILVVIGMLLEPLFKKLLSLLHINSEGKFLHCLQIVRTVVLVNIGMLIFRADTLEQAFEMFVSCFKNLTFDLHPIMKLGLRGREIFLVLGGVFVVFVVSLMKEKGITIRESIDRWNIAARWAFYLSAVLVVTIFGAYGAGYDVAHFIYAQF